MVDFFDTKTKRMTYVIRSAYLWKELTATHLADAPLKAFPFSSPQGFELRSSSADTL